MYVSCKKVRKGVDLNFHLADDDMSRLTRVTGANTKKIRGVIILSENVR